MGRKPGPLNAATRRDLARKAFQLAIRRVTFTEISRSLDISRQLVSTLVSEEQERQWEDRGDEELKAEKQRAISTYEEVIRAAWQRVGRIKDNSLNVSGLFNVIISSQKAIDEITGVKVVEKDPTDDILKYLDLMDKVTSDVEDMSE